MRIEDLRGKNVVVTVGTTSEKIVKTMNDERILKINIIESKDHGESFKAVDDGRAVAFPMDDVLLYGLISKSKKPDDFAVVGNYLSVEPYAIMMRRDEPQFEKIVNRALIDLFQSGEIRRIYAQVVQHQGPDGAAQPVPEGSLRGAEHLSGVAVADCYRRVYSEAPVPDGLPTPRALSNSIGTGNTMVELRSPAMLPSVCR